jgi:alpha-L-fucosidase
MAHFISKFIVIGCVILLISSCKTEHSKLDQLTETDSHVTNDSWEDHKFSMFIHWGLYSIPAGVWNGQQITGYSEQIKGHAKIPTEDYRKLAAQFDPIHWDADAVALMAKQAGMKSIVLTAKHHDGFCLFDSKYTTFDVVDATPYKKDIVKELAEASKRHNLKFGVYFSLIDWDYEGALPFESVDNSDAIPPLHHQYNLNQIEELLTNYGDISEIWFDMGSPTYDQSNEMATLVKKLQPNCMISGRIWNDQGDFVVMGDNKQPDFKMGVPWQTPASMFNETWSYRSW